MSATTPVAAGNNGIAIGSNASNTTTHGSSNALAIGTNAVADYWATALGAGTDATGNSSLAVGYNSQATGTKSTAIMNSYASGTGAFAAAIDNNTSSYGAHGTKAIAIGHQAKVNAGTTTGIAIGDTAWCYGTQSIAIGYGAVASAKWAVSLNRVSEASAQGSAALGYNAKASGLYSTALAYARSSGDYSFAAGIGDNSTTYGSKHVYGVALGYQAVTTADKQIALGSSTAQVKVSGTYTLPTADGTANQVLTTDGSGAVTFATAGGGADLYAANEVSVTAQPSATGDDAIAIGDSAVASGVNAVASGAFSIASGTSSFAAGGGTASGFASLAIGGISGGGKAVASSDTAIALGYQASASNYQAVAIGRESNSSGDSSLALGRTTSAVGDYSTSIGKSYAGGSYSFAAAINNQSSSYGALGTSSVVIGSQNKAASGSTGALVLGRSSLASVEDCYAIGYGCTASGYYSMALGRQAVAQTNGKMAFSSGKFATDGDAQTGKFVLRSDTTDATPEALTTNNGTANTTSQVVLPNNSVYGFTGTIIARENSAQTNDFAVWEVKGGAVRAASASTTALGSYNINKISESTGAANWSIAISADTTNGAIAFTVTGEASHSIRWVATINTTEVTY